MKVIVIGAGPAGYEAALSLRREGFETILIEKERPGGVCVNSGCIPTRVYLQAIKSAEALSAAGFPQEKLPGHILRQTAVFKINQLSYDMAAVLQKRKVECLQGEAVQAAEGSVLLADGTRLDCDEIVIATGSEPVIPEGYSWKRQFTVEELLSLTDLPPRLHIVGGGVLGVELAVILQYMGVHITVHEKKERLLPDWDPDVSRTMTHYLKSLGVEVVTGEKTASLENIVFCCGRKPLIPELAGNPAKVHVIGDAAAVSFTADAAAEEGRRMGAVLSGREAGPEASLTARCIFTPLEAAATGCLCGEGMKESFLPADMTASGILFGMEGAFIKAVMEESTHLLKGFHIVSNAASEVIQLGQMAVASEMTAEKFLETLLPHPTEGELLKEAVRNLL